MESVLIILDFRLRAPASPSCNLYEPEAVGAIGAYAPEGFWICGIATLYQFLHTTRRVSGFSAAAGLKSGQSNQIKNLTKCNFLTGSTGWTGYSYTKTK